MNYHYSLDQKFKNSEKNNCVGNTKLLNTGCEFNIPEFAKAKLIAIIVGLKMDFNNISCCEMCGSFYELQVNIVISSF